MAVNMKVEVDAWKLMKELRSFSSDQVPFATATALNNIAAKVMKAEQDNMKSTFEHPTPFTLNSVRTSKARKNNLTASVFVMDTAARYLEPYEVGGLHVLNKGSKAILNPKDIPLNAYGNLPRGKLAALKARKDIFIGEVKTKHGVINGVWQRPTKPTFTKTGKLKKMSAKANATGNLKLLIRFTNPKEVTKHLDFEKRGMAIVERGFQSEMRRAMWNAMKTRR